MYLDQRQLTFYALKKVVFFICAPIEWGLLFARIGNSCETSFTWGGVVSSVLVLPSVS